MMIGLNRMAETIVEIALDSFFGWQQKVKIPIFEVSEAITEADCSYQHKL